MDAAPTRRAVLLSAAGIVVGAGAGAAFAAFRPEPSGGRASPPPELVAAADAEAALLAIIDAETAAHGQLQPLGGIRADHSAHLSALRQALAAYPGAAATASSSPAPPRPSASGDTALTRVRLSEQRASTAAAERARVLSGPAAAVLASISACEATHVALF